MHRIHPLLDDPAQAFGALKAAGRTFGPSLTFSLQGALYFAVFLTVGAIAPGIAGTIVWSGNTFGNHYKKATSMGMVFSLGNSGGIVASEVYRSSMAPRYLPAHGVTLGFCFVSSIANPPGDSR